MTYVLTIGQVQTLQPVDTSLSRATYDDDVLTKSSRENPVREDLQIDFAMGNVFCTFGSLGGGGRFTQERFSNFSSNRFFQAEKLLEKPCQQGKILASSQTSH